MIPGNPLTGCVGTAMATSLKYHNFPERGTGSYNGVNFDVAYDWDNMRMDNYRSGYTEAEAEAVATLVYHAASSIGTQFGYSGSSAYEVKVPAALTNYFSYDPGVSYKKRSETATQAEFDRIVENEIRAGRPVLYCGQDVTAGHAFVVDGFDPLSNMIHINWGWGGASGNGNGGWYASTALNPTVSQTHSFNNLTTIIYNIKPGDGNNAAWSPLHITADGRQTGMSSNLEGDLTPGKSFTVRVGNIKNVSYDRFGGKIAVALFGADGTFKSTLSNPDGFHLDGMAIFGSAYADFACQLPAAAEVADDDVIRMATLADGSDKWLPVPGELITTNEIPAKGAAPQYFSVTYPSSINDATFTGDNKVIRGWNYNFKVVPAYPARDVVTVKNNGYVLTPDANYNYAIRNVLEDQNIEVYVQNAADVKEKRSIWVGTPGTLETLLDGPDAGTVKDLTLFGTIDARDFTFMRSSMKLRRLDLSGVRIAANGTNQANAIPREAFRNLWSLKEVILPSSVNRLNNGAFRSCGITSIVIPAAVTTYEYNVFNGSSGLRDVWVRNPKPAFINWCVFHGTPKDRTVHCINMGAAGTYKADKYWNQPDIDAEVTFTCPWEDKNEFPGDGDCAFAVMENDEVRYVSDTEPGRYEAGKQVTFTAEHIVDNDNRMEVYANSTLLKPDAEGKYTATINGGTIIHFDMVEPTAPATYDSPWKLTDTGGTIGLLTDAVNVLPGIPFTVRANSFEVTDNMFWAFVLTTADGKIKEFISSINNWTGGPGKGLKMNVNCCVKDANVREGNLIRFATSYNGKTWALVKGANENIVDALPALNNQTPVYNFTFPEGIEEKANIAGRVESAVRGRDLTFKITPKSASHTLDVAINGDTIMKGGKTFTHSFIAKEDLDFYIKVIPPVSYTEATIVLKEGEHLYLDGSEGISNWGEINYQTAEKYKNIKKLKIVGKLDYYDFNLFRENYWIATNIKYLDLSEAQFVRDRDAQEGQGLDNLFPSSALYNKQLGGCYIEEIILPATLTQFAEKSFKGCSKLREIKLPENLRNWSTGPTLKGDGISVSDFTRGGLYDEVFLGCNSLETIYLPCAPGAGGNVGHLYYSSYHELKTGLSDNKKVTVVVPSQYLAAYKTPRVENGFYAETWSNGWVAGGFNIVGEYPVYSLDFDASKCFVTDAEIKDNVSRAASFLKDNIGLESMERKLYIGVRSNIAEGRPEGMDAFDAARSIKVYDNDVLLPDDAIAADGSITVTYWNPNTHADKSGNHEIKVVYFYNVNFNRTSDNVQIIDENGYNLTSSEISEGTTVRFKVDMAGLNTEELTAMVKIGETVLSRDEEGYYNVEVTDTDLNIDVYTVPRNGATLTAADIESINASAASNVTSIAFKGDIDSEKLKQVIDEFPEIEELDLSDLTTALPADAMAGKETLTTVTLPQAADIEDGTFSGCVNLANVSVPETVSYIGNNAFSGCSSLENLSFTGIKGIGDNAFAGCDNLTTIIFNSQRGEAPARARRVARAPRADGYSEGAFNGLNPNCLIYLDENEDVPQDIRANYVKVTTVESEAGKERIYQTTGSIALDADYPFNAINPFTLAEGNDISIELDLLSSDGKSSWSQLLLPFEPTAVTDASDNDMIIFDSPEAVAARGRNYMAATLAEGKTELSLAGKVEANKPYVTGLHTLTPAGKVRFSASDITVAQTPAEIRSEGDGYAMLGTFGKRTLNAATTYRLDAEGSSFAADNAVAYAEDSDADTNTEVGPFAVYVEAPADSQPLEINIPIDELSGVDDITNPTAGLIIKRDGDMLVIDADRACEVKVYDISGILVRVLHLSAGSNTVDGLPAGIYILNGIKTKL